MEVLARRGSKRLEVVEARGGQLEELDRRLFEVETIVSSLPFPKFLGTLQFMENEQNVQ